jgi:hypothetical protein
MAGLVPLFLWQKRRPDFVGVVPQVGAILTLLVGWVVVVVRDIAFVPATIVAWVLFGLCAWFAGPAEAEAARHRVGGRAGT